MKRPSSSRFLIVSLVPTASGPAGPDAARGFFKNQRLS